MPDMSTTVLACQKCSRVWAYSGSADRATCPSCKAKVPVERFKVEKIDDIVVQLREQMNEIQEGVDRRRETYGEMKQRIVELEDRIEELEVDDDEFGGFDFEADDDENTEECPLCGDESPESEMIWIDPDSTDYRVRVCPSCADES